MNGGVFDVAHSLRGEGFDASEDGTGRGTPLVPVAFAETAPTLSVGAHGAAGHPHRQHGNETAIVGMTAWRCPDCGNAQQYNHRGCRLFPAVRTANTSANGHGISAELAHTLDQAQGQAVAIGFDSYNQMLTGDITQTIGTSLELNPNVLAPTLTATNDPSRSPQSSEITAQVAAITASAMQVRRLTPLECERLQGFPTVSEKLTLEVCIDPQNSSARVAIQCHRWQNSAWPADVSASTQHAGIAVANSSTHRADPEPLAALHVRMHSEDELLEVRSRGRLIWSANGAGASSRCLPSTLPASTVRELARLQREVARTVGHGKAASPLSISLFFPASSGAISAERSGPETAGSANDAMSDPNKGIFTTSDLGRITMSSDSTAQTLCCSVLRAIAGCIPSETPLETFSIELTVETPYTAIPWRGKPASECPDGPRYKALGNSWAVPCVRWIGRRIVKAEQSVGVSEKP